MLTVGGILLYRRLRNQRRAKADASDSANTPMISSFNRLAAQSTFSFHAPNSPMNTYQPPSSAVRPPPSPLSSYHDGSSGSASSSSSDHSVKSPMSDHSSQFHFPLLSADGHLMPPAPASSRGSWYIAEGDLGSGAGTAGRPLPFAPGEEGERKSQYDYEYGYDYSPDPYESEHDHQAQAQAQTHLIAPAPRTPKRWSYEPPHSTPSPDRSDESVQQIVGLYPSIDFRGDGTIEYGYNGVDSASIRSSPRVARVEDTFGFHQPQSAVYHRSFSAEGEEIRADR